MTTTTTAAAPEPVAILVPSYQREATIRGTRDSLPAQGCSLARVREVLWPTALMLYGEHPAAAQMRRGGGP